MCYRTYSEREHVNDNFFSFCKQNSIMRSFFVPNTPYQIGVAKQMNITLFWIETIVMVRVIGVTKYF